MALAICGPQGEPTSRNQNLGHVRVDTVSLSASPGSDLHNLFLCCSYVERLWGQIYVGYAKLGPNELRSNSGPGPSSLAGTQRGDSKIPRLRPDVKFPTLYPALVSLCTCVPNFSALFPSFGPIRVPRSPSPDLRLARLSGCTNSRRDRLATAVMT